MAAARGSRDHHQLGPSSMSHVTMGLDQDPHDLSSAVSQLHFTESDDSPKATAGGSSDPTGPSGHAPIQVHDPCIPSHNQIGIDTVIPFIISGSDLVKSETKRDLVADQTCRTSSVSVSDTAQAGPDRKSSLAVGKISKPFSCPVISHTAQAESAGRPDRLGLESITHAPLNMRIYPYTPFSIEEFEMQSGKKASLGKGAMGNVRLVRWKRYPDRPYRALKRISKFQMWKDDNPVMLFEQLWDEIESLMSLNHENIVGLDGYFEDYQYVYLIMEYAPNGDLNQMLGDHKQLSEMEASRHIRSLIRALLYCHQHNYLHRDIKPENLLLSSKGDLLLADFGCVATRYSTRKSVCGTRHYHAVEVTNNEEYDEACDAWSVGVVTYELLYGKSPFESDDDVDDDDEEESDEEEDDQEESDEEEVGQEESDEDGEGQEESDEEQEDSDVEDHDEDEIEDDDCTTVSDEDRDHLIRADHEDSSDEYQDAHETEQSMAAPKGVHTRFRDVQDANQYDDERTEVQEDEPSTHEDQDESGGDDNSDENGEDTEDDDESNASSEDSQAIQAIYSRIQNLDYSFPGFFSDNAKDFIKRLLDKDRSSRMSLADALNHPFICN